MNLEFLFKVVHWPSGEADSYMVHNGARLHWRKSADGEVLVERHYIAKED